MESLSDTVWDVVLAGTGLPQSLLALALSRSGKKVLHIDKNDYYGGLEAALSLQEAETWAESVGEGAGSSPYRHATIKNLEREAPAQEADGSLKLGFSRAYSLSLSPQLIYTRSNLLPVLVSSKVYRQLEFLAVGSWWIYDNKEVTMDGQDGEGEARQGGLRRIPGGREDVFADKTIDLRSTRSLMKFLKLAADSEAHMSILEEWGYRPFPDFLESHLSIPPRLQAPLLALTSSPNTPTETLTSYALPRIHRHLTSIGMFGPGFGAVIPKWGGLAEIAQVACRAGAVGGGVYVLKRGFETDETPDLQASGRNSAHFNKDTGLSTLCLQGGEQIRSHWVVGSIWDLPLQTDQNPGDRMQTNYVARSITIVSGSLAQLFPSPAEGAPPPAGAVVVYPTGTLEPQSADQTPGISGPGLPPVYLIIHSSDTGECPAGQCVIYACSFYPTNADSHQILQAAVTKLLTSIHEDPPATVLWYMHYDQRYNLPATTENYEANSRCDHFPSDHVLQLPDVAPGLALEDDVLKHVRAAYQSIVGNDGAAFMLFDDREGTGDDVDEN